MKKKKKKVTAWRVVFSFLSGMFIIIISSRLGELLSHYRVYSSSSFIIHLLCPSWDIDILDTPSIMNRQSLPTSPLLQSDPKMRNQSRWT